jgi:RNA-directed DNA polymerase
MEEEAGKHCQLSTLEISLNHSNPLGGVFFLMPRTTDTTNGEDIFSGENRRQCEKYVLKMQRQIHKAVEAGKVRKAKYLTYLLTRRSKATKILATYNITSKNEGKHTPGTDGMCLPKGTNRNQKKHIMSEILAQVSPFRKPKSIRRVYIQKANGKQRPLGIPVMLDRISQDVIRMAIQPILEFHFDDCSYGFRPKRSCHDASADIYQKLKSNAPKSPVWIVEGDIKGCFDNIDKEAILMKLRQWHLPEKITTAIKRILDAPILEGQTLMPTEKGTAQGGVISPMLANVALTTLDESCRTDVSMRNYTPLTRYADDWTLVCPTLQEAKQWKTKLSDELKTEVGLELSEEKTQITHLSYGFDFLGKNVRKYYPKSRFKRPKLLIKPADDKVKGFLRDIRQTIKSMRQATTENVIRTLNPKIIGWGLYYRHDVSKKTFKKVDNQIHHALFRWSKRRHSNKGKKWIKDKYFKTFGNNNWTFTSQNGTRLTKMAAIPIKRYVKVRKGMKLYASDKETIQYWQERELRNAISQIYSVRIEKLYQRQQGRCPYCKQIMTDISQTHTHHILPTKYGGKDQLNNLRLMHLDCHIKLHSDYSLTQMRDNAYNGKSNLKTCSRK